MDAWRIGGYALVNVKLYVEGGGDSKELHSRCREGFRKLLEKSGFSCCMPQIIAGGGRNGTYNRFRSAFFANHDPNITIILLVDSEDPLTTSPWTHLNKRDGWERPNGASDDQVQLMVTCMETWIMADRQALRHFFGDCLKENRLLPAIELESRPCHEVQTALDFATRDCGRNRQYHKGDISFQVMAVLTPEILQQYLPNFQRLVDTLHNYLDE